MKIELNLDIDEDDFFEWMMYRIDNDIMSSVSGTVEAFNNEDKVIYKRETKKEE